MAAKDYEIVSGWLNAYLVKKKKHEGKGPQIMSTDRRIINDNEILGLFEFYLRKRYINTGDDTVVIKDGAGKILFEATLLDKKDDDDEKG